MRLVHLAIAFALVSTTACAKKQPAPAKPMPSNAEPAATGGSAAPTETTPAPAKSESRGPVKKGGDPCEGGQ